ncbi:hypothetical protein ACJJTC_014748 [Scirpophaga incertulas]
MVHAVQEEVTNSNTTALKQPPQIDLVKQITEKVYNISKMYIDEPNSFEENPLIDLKRKIAEIVQNNYNLMQVPPNKIATLTDIIIRGVELMMKDLDNGRKNMKNNLLQNTENTMRIDVSHEDQENNQFTLTIEREDTNSTTKISNRYGVTTLPYCGTALVEICTDVKLLTQFVCKSTGKVLSLKNVCDGAVDCASGSDEENCLEKAKSRVSWAIQLMSSLESYLLGICYKSNEKSLLIKQTVLLTDIISRQMNYLTNYTSSENLVTDKRKTHRVINEFVFVMDSLAIAVDGALCSQHLRNDSQIDAIVHKQIVLIDNNIASYDIKPKEWCSCSGSFCSNITCPEACKNYCWFKNSLNRFPCQAVDESTSVALDVLCDNKLDCYDETDEASCNTGAKSNKFEANQMYDKVLKMLITKTISKEYSSVHQKLLALYHKVERLQKITQSIKVDVASVKSFRDDSFFLLVLLYEDLLKNSAPTDLDEIQIFLMSINENLTGALKRSHTGNVKILSRAGCICRESRCISYKCSESCHRACGIRPMLARYWCKGSLNNISIPIEWICNKMVDCPYQDDEAQCIRGVCGKHHLVQLRQRLRDIGEKETGTALGEKLKSWRSKAMNILASAEKSYRPTPTTLREIVSDILQDLAMTYGSMEFISKRNNNNLVKEFVNLSKQVMQSLRSCSE